MNCNLVDNWFAVQFRAAKRPDFGVMMHCMPRDRRFRWRFPTGSYAMHRNDTQLATDDDLVVASALRGQTSINETLRYQGIVQHSSRHFAVRAFGPLGVKDDAVTPDSHEIKLITDPGEDPSEIFPPPAPPVSFSVTPGVNGTIVVTVNVNNVLAVTPAAEVSIYTDGGTGGAIDYVTPLGNREPVGPAYGAYAITRDPALAHGATLSIAVLTRSATGVESDPTAASSTPQSVVIDSQGPPAMTGVTVGTVC